MNQAIDSHKQAGIVQGFILSLATFLPIMAALSVAPAIPSLIQHFHDVPNVKLLVPMLMSVPAICIAIASPLCGWLTDRMGRRRVLLAGIVIYGLFGMAPLLLDSLHAILVTRAGVGVAEALLFTVGKTLIGDYFTGERRQRWVGYQNAIDACLGTGTWLAGGLLAALSWRAPFFLYILSIPLFIAVWMFIWEPASSEKPETTGDEAATSTPFPWKRMSMVFAVTTFCGAMYFSYSINIARALTELGVETASRIGVLTAIASIGTPLGALLYTRATSISNQAMIGIALAFIGGAYIAIGNASHFNPATAYGFFEQVGNGLMGAALTTWCLGSLPFEHRGRGMGLWGTFMVSGIFISPILFAYMEKATGSVLNGFSTLGMICVVSAVLIPILIRVSGTGGKTPGTQSG